MNSPPPCRVQMQYGTSSPCNISPRKEEKISALPKARFSGFPSSLPPWGGGIMFVTWTKLQVIWAYIPNPTRVYVQLLSFFLLQPLKSHHDISYITWSGSERLKITRKKHIHVILEKYCESILMLIITSEPSRSNTVNLKIVQLYTT